MSNEFQEKLKHRQQPSSIKIIVVCLFLIFPYGIGAFLGLIALRFLPCVERPEPDILIFPDSQLMDNNAWDINPFVSLISYTLVSNTDSQNIIQFYENAEFTCRVPSQNPNRTLCSLSPTDWYSYEVNIDHLQEPVEYVIEISLKKRCVPYTEWHEFN